MSFGFNIPTDETYAGIGQVSIFFLPKNCFSATATLSSPGYEGKYSITDPNGIDLGGQFVSYFRDTALAYFASNTTNPSNKTTLDALTQQFGQDYADWYSLSFDVPFNHILDIEQNGLIDCTEWEINGDCCYTRIYSYPINYGVRELGHYDYAHECTATQTPCVGYFGPPGICTAASAFSQCSSSTGNILALALYQLCLEDGRLVPKFMQMQPIC